MTQAPKNIVITGGSLGGLFAGVALKRLNKNLNIRIFERNPTPLLHDQGAGVVAGHDVQQFFKQYDQTNAPLTVTSRQRLYLDRGGKVIDHEESTQQMTSWDLLYHVLRANYDGVESEYVAPVEHQNQDEAARYEYGCTVTRINVPEPSSPTPDFSTPIKVEGMRNTGERFSTDADLFIAADGPSSTIRSLFFPSVQRRYVGYVAWRGTVPENSLTADAADVFLEKFTFFHTSGTQILAYTIPGHNGSLEEGKRLVNWVWYCNYNEESPEHVELMTDKDGRRHHITLPPGGIQDRVWMRQKDLARDHLPPQFSEIIQKTKVPFVQAITDAIAPSALLSGGRVVLLGDALANFRPHTAASTNQAAMDASRLAEAVGKIVDGGGVEELRNWEKHVVEYAQEVQRHGVNLGNRSQFGEHPLRG
ncbi:monooxygenase [Dendryphion nanum]|uniref:Monooxygenase n=1 Tax=Dendryphion nanum TaxID=256645 RepID=A0A9P9IRA1_9PLEO|nr:monooxygenase [Dendryphion nanum]